MSIGDRSDDLMHALYDRREAHAAAIEAEAEHLRRTRSWLVRHLAAGTAPDALIEALRDAWFPDRDQVPDAIAWEAAALFGTIPPEAEAHLEAFVQAEAERRLGL